MTAGGDDAKARSRILRALSRGPAAMARAADGRGLLLDFGDRGTIAIDARSLARLAREGSVRVDGDRVVAAGNAADAGQAPGGRNRDIEPALIETGSGRELVAVNWSESPLAQLMRRKDRNGTPFLALAEYQAGERLRADYTRGQIMPRLSANWEASVSSGRRTGGIADLNDAAIAARQRVEQAIAAVGPELAGVLIDACCFLKGMETLEMERGWPARSAKVVLKTALGVLSRHYNPAPAGKADARRTMLHWGTADYRPSLS